MIGQELVKINAAAYNFDFHVNFGMSGRYKQPVQYGCPASPEKEDQTRCKFPCRVDSAGPVSPTCNRFIRPKAGNAP